MARLTQVLCRSSRSLLGAGALVAVAVVRLPSLPAQIDTALTGSSCTKTVLDWFELNSAHYVAQAASFGGAACTDFPMSTSTTAPLYDGWHFVITPDSSAYDVKDWQVVFRNGANALHSYRITRSGSTVTPVPSTAVRFSQAYTQIQVLTPTSGHHTLLKATDAALTAPAGAPYRKTIYAHSANPAAVGTLGSPGTFPCRTCVRASRSRCYARSDCRCMDDGSVLTVPAEAVSGLVEGTLTCNSVPEAGETVRFTNVNGVVSTATTSSTSGFNNTFAATALPVTVSFPGSAPTRSPRSYPSQLADARPRSRRPRSRRLARVCVPVRLLPLTVGWLGFRALQVQQHVAAARGVLTQARSELLAGRTDVPALRAAAVETHAARTASRDRVWTLVSPVAVAGDPLRTAAGTAAGIADVSDRLASRALPDLPHLTNGLQALHLPAHARAAHRQRRHAPALWTHR